MHEASIVEELIATVARRTPPGAQVLEVRVKVGLLTGVSPDAMAFYFEALAPETLGSQAALVARIEPLRGRCSACDRAFELEDPTWLCPGCGAPTLVFENGDELDLDALVIDDGQPDHDRAEDPPEER
jgi:hydrogenase nickel incorporation protein HypA/HybF